MFVESDDVFVTTLFQFRKPCYSFADGAHFIKQAVLRDLAMPKTVKTLSQGLMDRRRFANALAPSKLIDQRYRGRVLDVQRHGNLQILPFDVFLPQFRTYVKYVR